MDIYQINQILLNQNAKYSEFWSEVMEVNQTNINNTTDFNDRQILQATQDKIARYINQQSEIIEYLLKQLAKAPTHSELEYYKRYAKHARFYIQNLGGNVSNLSYIKDTDLC